MTRTLTLQYRQASPRLTARRPPALAAGTPLVASSTGGLADRVQHYSEADGSGSGLLVEDHTHTALLRQLEHALALYADARHYAALRRNAWDAACDVGQTACHWHCELQRLRACMAARTLQAEE